MPLPTPTMFPPIPRPRNSTRSTCSPKRRSEAQCVTRNAQTEMRASRITHHASRISHPPFSRFPFPAFLLQSAPLMQDVLNYLEENQSRFVLELCDYLRFPSVSA